MRRKPDKDIPEPTPVEAPLVAAIRDHREEWPLVYAEMKGVCKDDLLADAEYCSRHRHPSMTQFFRECGLIGGIHESMLRKFERAGRFYDRFLSEFPGSPRPDDGRVAAMSPDTLILVDRIDGFLAMGAPSMGSERHEIVGRLVGDLLEGRGLRRRELNAWLASLQDAAEHGALERCVGDFIASVTGDAAGERGLFEHAGAGLRLESRVRLLLRGGEWLSSLGARDGTASPGRVEIVDEPGLRVGDDVLRPDFAVLETVTDELAVHVVETRGRLLPGMLGEGVFGSRTGADYAWAVVAERPGNAAVARCESAGVGLMVLEGGALEVVVLAARREPPEGRAAALCRGLLARMVSRRPKPSPSYEYSFTMM